MHHCGSAHLSGCFRNRGAHVGNVGMEHKVSSRADHVWGLAGDAGQQQDVRAFLAHLLHGRSGAFHGGVADNGLNVRVSRQGQGDGDGGLLLAGRLVREGLVDNHIAVLFLYSLSRAVLLLGLGDRGGQDADLKVGRRSLGCSFASRLALSALSLGAGLGLGRCGRRRLCAAARGAAGCQRQCHCRS